MNSATPAVLRRMRPLLGTYVEIGARAQAGEDKEAQAAINAAFKAIEQLQASLSFHAPDSELSRLNRSNGRAMALSPAALRVLRLARGMTMASRGLFNCTVAGALVRSGRLPDHDGAEILPAGVADDIEIRIGAARLRRPIRITLDGIAKGYAVDRAIAMLRRHGVPTGWVNAGGDLRVYGDYVLPVRFRDAASADGTLGLQNAALASSAGAAQYDAALPGEIIVADSAKRAVGAWSVISTSAWRADALTKVAALAGPAQRDALLQRLGGRLVFAS